MLEVWEPLDAEAVPRFNNRDVVGHDRKQQLNYADLVHRLVVDKPRYANPTYDIRDIIARRISLQSASGLGQPDQPGNQFLWR